MTEAVEHCLAKITALSACADPDRRTVLQLGYNLGRLSELTRLGRDVWDRWKVAVAGWEPGELHRLAQDLRSLATDEIPPPGSA